MLVADPDAPGGRVSVVGYGADAADAREVDVSELSALTGRYDVLWVDVEGVCDADVVREVGRCFNLHPLTLEDTMHVVQRPKFEEYDDYLFIVARTASLGECLETEQLSIFLGTGFVVTFREGPTSCFEPVRDRIVKGRSRIRELGADYLAYALLDAAVDQLTPITDALGDRLGELEEDVMRGSGSRVVGSLLEVSHDLEALRRIASPLREALLQLRADDVPFIVDDTRVYFRDCQDHVAQILDAVDTWRAAGTNLMAVHLAVSGQDMNGAMKVLTVIATIFIPLSFIAGVYGMNFNTTSPWNMPELNWFFGYPFALSLMLAVAVGQLLFFRRKGWLGSGNE